MQGVGDNDQWGGFTASNSIVCCWPGSTAMFSGPLRYFGSIIELV